MQVLGKVIDKTEEELNIQHEVFTFFRKKIEKANCSPAQLEELFEEFDLNGDKKLNEEEFRRAIHSIGCHVR